MKDYLPENTQRNRVFGYRIFDWVILILAVVSAVGWAMRDKPPSEKEVLADKVETLTRQIDSIQAGQLGTYDYLIQQSQETEMQFQQLSIEVDINRGLVLEVTK